MPIEAAHEVVAALVLLVLALLVVLLLLLQPATTSAPTAVKAMITLLSMGTPPFPWGLSLPGPGIWADETMRCPPGKEKRFRGLAGSFDSIAICASADAPRERKLPMTDMLRPRLGIATVPCGTSWLRAGTTSVRCGFRCSAVVL
jgi:hypothetical protein